MSLSPPVEAGEWEEWVRGLTAKQLKELIVSRGFSHADCVEKGEFQRRALDILRASAEKSGKPVSSNSSEHANPPCPAPLETVQKDIGGYRCLVVAPKDASPQNPADLLLIMLHGYGATNQDFVFLAEALSSSPQLKGKRMMAVLPQAFGYPPQWWELDVMEYIMAQQSEEGLARLIRRVPPGLDHARESLMRLVEQSRSLGGVPADRVILGGFSQGAMTAADLALHMPLDQRVAGVCMISGAPIVVEEWAKKAARHKGLPVFISHGTKDPVLPFAASNWSRDLFKTHGLDVHHETHTGAHELGPPHIQAALAEFIAKCIEKSGSAL